jgi:hypothetical protein
MSRAGWAARFDAPHLVKGEKAAYRPVLLSKADDALLVRAAQVAGLTPTVLMARIVIQVLHQNLHRFELDL